jgi:hypothetical protein
MQLAINPKDDSIFASASLIFFADSFCNYSQIVDHANVFQLPEAMKTTDAFIRSAQELLFDAVCDVDVNKVPHYISKLKISSLIVFTACRKFHFQARPR